MEELQELQTLGITKRSDMTHPEVGRSLPYDPYDRDQQDLARLGKRQVLKVRAMVKYVGYVLLCSCVVAELWLHVDVGL